MGTETRTRAIGFVDVLIGAMAAAILLFVAQANRPPAKRGFGVGGAELRVWVDGKETQAPLPGLAIRYRLRDWPQALAAGDLKQAGEGRIFPGPEPDGSPSHRVRFTEKADFKDGDVLLVYLYDLNGRPRLATPDVVLKAELIGRSAEVRPPGSFRLGADHPVLVVPLAHVSGQRGQEAKVDWSQP